MTWNILAVSSPDAATKIWSVADGRHSISMRPDLLPAHKTMSAKSPWLYFYPSKLGIPWLTHKSHSIFFPSASSAIPFRPVLNLSPLHQLFPLDAQPSEVLDCPESVHSARKNKHSRFLDMWILINHLSFQALKLETAWLGNCITYYWHWFEQNKSERKCQDHLLCIRHNPPFPEVTVCHGTPSHLVLSRFTHKVELDLCVPAPS